MKKLNIERIIIGMVDSKLFIYDYIFNEEEHGFDYDTDDKRKD